MRRTYHLRILQLGAQRRTSPRPTVEAWRSAAEMPSGSSFRSVPCHGAGVRFWPRHADLFFLSNGFAVAALASLGGLDEVKRVLRLVDMEEVTPGAVLVLGLALVGAVWVLVFLSRKAVPTGEVPVRAPAPISGLGMTASAGALMSLPATLANFFPALLSTQRSLQNSQVLYTSLWASFAVLLTVGWSLAFFRPRAVAALGKRSADSAMRNVVVRPGRPTGLRAIASTSTDVRAAPLRDSAPRLHPRAPGSRVGRCRPDLSAQARRSHDRPSSTRSPRRAKRLRRRPARRCLRRALAPTA